MHGAITRLGAVAFIVHFLDIINSPQPGYNRRLRFPVGQDDATAGQVGNLRQVQLGTPAQFGGHRFNPLGAGTNFGAGVQVAQFALKRPAQPGQIL